jgi:ribosomal protein S18 acetylase RimI-like enzyme
MKCKITKTSSSGLIKEYGYFDDLKQIAKCEMREKIRGELKGTFTLSSVSIIPEYRGKGLCKKFLECVLKDYSDKTIFLAVLIDNEPALKCYTSLGFQEVDKGRSTLYMRKN